jgi:hypothetical protein
LPCADSTAAALPVEWVLLSAARANPQPYSALGLLFLGILAPILYGFIGFLMGALTAWVYNFAARRIGGIQLELKPAIANSQMWG